MGRPAMADIIDVIRSRWDVLVVLNEAPHTKPEIEEVLDVSRSTINRAVSDLEEVDLVERSPPTGYQITAFGQPIYNLHVTMGGCLAGICEAYPIGPDLPDGSQGEILMFDDATIFYPEPHAPDLPLLEVLERIRKTTSLRVVTPAVLEQYVNVCYERVVQDHMKLELLISTTVRDHLKDDYPSKFIDLIQQSNVGVYEQSQPLPFGLMLFEEGSTPMVGLILYSQAGVGGFIVNDGRLARGWGSQLYSDCKSMAAEIEASHVQNSL